MLDDLLTISDPAYLIHRDGIIHLGFVAADRHIGILHIREADLKELMTALRRHFPNRPYGTAHGIARLKVKGSPRGHREFMHSLSDRGTCDAR